jgi:NADPH:quinone reductase-like Zn-dependent oxidoreductase
MGQLDLDVMTLYQKEQTIIGCNSTTHPQEKMANFLKSLNPLLESGELKAPGLSKYTEITLERAAEAYTSLINGSRTKYLICQTYQ